MTLTGRKTAEKSYEFARPPYLRFQSRRFRHKRASSDRGGEGMVAARSFFAPRVSCKGPCTRL